MNFPDTSSTSIFGGGGYDATTGLGTFGTPSSGGGGDFSPSTMPNDPGSVFGTNLPTGYDPVSGQISSTPSIWGSLPSILAGAGSSGGTSTTPATSGSGLAGFLNNLWSGNPANGGLSGLGPYAAVGALGISQAKDAQNQAKQEAGQMAQLGQPYLSASQQLLQQYQNQQLTPTQQNFVNLSNQYGDQLQAAATPLQQIAQSAFADYNSGKLNQADELNLQNQIAAQKQQVRQTLASQGITDSSVLTAQDQQIDNQATIMRQQLLDARFATGNQAYDSWLKTTTEGQQLKLQGQQFATQQFEQMLNDSLGLGNEGMQPAMQAIQLQIQSDQELSQQVNQLLGNLAAAYSYAAAGPRTGGAGPGGGGGGGGGGSSGSASTVSQIVSGVNAASNLVGLAGKVFNFNGAGGQAANPLGGTAGIVNDVAGIYSGIKQGGVMGYGTAAVDATKLGSQLGVFGQGVGQAAGYVAAPLSVYNAVENWQSGDTKGDTIRGAEAGASVGTAILPGVGTVVGGVIGAAVGAISSAFGPGKESDSHKAWEQLYWGQEGGKAMAADLKGAQIPTKAFEESLLGFWQSNQSALSTFTKMDGGGKHGGNAEGFKGWITQQLAQGISSGKIKQGMDSQQIFQSYIAPAMNQYWKSTGSNMTIENGQFWGAPQKKIITDLVDRAMTGQPISRNAENYDGEGSGYAAIPSLTQVLQSMQSRSSIPTQPQAFMYG